jgi:flavodoxin
MKALVVYYSNSGTTRSVAEQIARAIDGDLEEIVERRPRPRLLDEDGKPAGGFAMARSALSAVLGVGSAIQRGQANCATYDVVIAGTPVWVGSLVPPVRSYLKQSRKSLKTVAFFCTCGQNEKLKAIPQMTRAAKKEPVATLTVTSEEVKKDECEPAVRNFVMRIRSSGSA